MNSKNTWLWFLVAATLFATIFGLNHFHSVAPAASNGWPDLQLAQATSIQVIPPGALEIRADRTNGSWFISKPYQYPAQTAAVQALLDSLAKATPAARITASELRQQPTAEQDYGFDLPLSLDIDTRAQQWQLKIGRRTAPGNQVYLRVVGVEGAFVMDAGWLKFLPQTANDWRDTSLVSTDGQYNWIVVTNGAKVIELRLNPTNHLWRMLRPLQARADSDRINRALQQLRSARVADFVTDEAHADLAAYELQPPNLDLWLGTTGPLSQGLHLGKTLTNNPALVFAKREGWNGVITTLNEPLSPWRGAVNDFRNSRLIDLTSPVNEIEVSVADNGNHFMLQRQGSNVWHVAGETFPVDAENAQIFMKLLASLHATEYVKDVVTAPDLQNYGLTKPDIQITLRPTAGDTNQMLAQLLFSAPQTNGVFVRRSDEDFIYRLDPTDLNRIPEAGWEFRDRRIGNFLEQDITQITVHQNGQTRQMLHNGRDQWALAPGSKGDIYGPTIEETAHQLGILAAVGWIGRNVTKPELFGVTTNSLQIEVGLKNGQNFKITFGNPIADQPVALVTVDGGQWAFIAPQSLYQLVLSYLTIPATVP